LHTGNHVKTHKEIFTSLQRTNMTLLPHDSKRLARCPVYLCSSTRVERNDQFQAAWFAYRSCSLDYRSPRTWTL